MKKLNKKGFTLIELLAVVVILLAISVIAVSSISAAIERNKAKQDEAKEEIILSYAKLYYEEKKNSLERTILTSGKTYGCIELGELDLSEDEMKDSDGDYITGKVKFSSGGTDFELVEESVEESGKTMDEFFN